MFEQTLLEMVQKTLGDKGIATLNEMNKMNMPLKKGIIIHFVNSDVAPVIYTDEYYERYKKGDAIGELAKEIVEWAQNGVPSCNFCREDFLNFEKARAHLTERVINFDLNEQLLKEVPHRRFLDLAVVYYYEIDKEGSVMIRNNHLTEWGISERDLVEAVPKQTHSALNMNAVLSKLMGMDYGTNATSRIYVLTNESMMYGATAILDSEFLTEVGQLFKEGTFYILPSSIHELIVVPAEDVSDTESLYEMVSQVNDTTVTQADYLSDSVYKYEKGRVTYAD